MRKVVLLRILLIVFNVSLLFMVFWLFLLRQEFKKNRKNINFALIVCLILLFVQYAVYLDAQYIEPKWIKIEKLRVQNKIFPDSLSKLKIIHVSDLHIKQNDFRERDMVKKINALKPDIILITGDMLTERGYVSLMLSVVSKMDAKKGIYAVLGDNDIYGGCNIGELKGLLNDIGIFILDNENIRIPINEKEGLWFIGISNNALNNETLKKIYEGVNLTEPKIVLCHYPEIADSKFLNKDNADLILSGGTHGGQIGVPIVRNVFDKISELKYISGLYWIKGIPLYVNRGIGTVGNLPGDTIRFFCRPEIALITLSRQK